MSGLFYVGANDTSDNALINRLTASQQVAAAPVSAGSVQAQLDGLTTGSGATYARKDYVDVLNSTFQPPSYYQARDDLNVLATSVGQPLGPAILDSNGKVPLSQVPVVGAGYLKGPYGPTFVPNAVVTSTNSTPTRIADWNIGVANVSFQLLVYLNAFVQTAPAANSYASQPVIEIRMANSTLQPAYSAMPTLVGQAVGRSLWTDYQAISVSSASSVLGATPALLPTNYSVWVTAWLWDLNPTATASMAAGSLASGSVYLLRGAQ